MKIKLKIKQPGYVDGEEHYNTTSFLMSHSESEKGYGSWRRNKFGEDVHTSERYGYSYAKRAEDPVFAGLSSTLNDIIFTNSNDYAHEKFFCEIGFKYPDGQVNILIEKKSGYSINGRRMNKGNLLAILSRIMYRTCFVKSRTLLKPYIRDLLVVPPNVRWALENRTPYFFYMEDERNPYRRQKVEVMLNTKRISRSKVALEISDSIWGAISIDDLDKMLNVYRFGQRRSKKWRDISPRNLWVELFNEEPSEADVKMMMAFMGQNRTEDMVENRAKALMQELEEEHEGVKNFNLSWDGMGGTKQAMFVRGKACDWVLVENNAAKTSPQRVHIYCFHERGNEGLEAVTDYGSPNEIHSPARFLNGYLRGPICVNNSVGNVSLGDQFASRAFTLLNDILSFGMVSTLKGYTPQDKHPHRINLDVLIAGLDKDLVFRNPERSVDK